MDRAVRPPVPGDIDLPLCDPDPVVEDVRRRLIFCLVLYSNLAYVHLDDPILVIYSSLSSRGLLPKDPVSLLSSIALRSISSSSYATRLFMVALLLVLMS